MFPRPVSRLDKIRGVRRATLAGLAVIGIALLGPAAGAFAAPEAPVNDRVIVQWQDGSSHAERVEARAEAGVTYVAGLGDPNFQLVETERASAAAAAAALEEDPAVAVAEPDGYRTLEALPNDPLFAEEWGLQNTGQTVNGLTGKAGNDIDVVNAWNRTVGTPSTVVADIDSGYRADSPDLGPVEWTNPGEIPGNGIDDDHDGYVDDVHGWDFVGENASSPTEDNDPTDSNVISGGHGVHTAGIIGAAGNNGTGITGVAQNVRIMPLRVCANEASVSEVRCPFSAIIAAINYAGDNGARVANLSLGGTVPSQLEINAYAEHPGTLYVIAAANDGANNDSGNSGAAGHHYPCDYKPATESSPVVPGAIENTICVAALDPAETLASYSDYGATSVDLGAPGTAVISTFPASETLLADNFQGNDFGSRWTPYGAGFARAFESPLTSFGITDTPGAAPEANHTYGVKLTTPIAVPAGTGACRLEGKRYRKGGEAPYGVIVDGTYHEYLGGESSSFAMTPFRTVPITGLGGHGVQPFFEYRAGSSPTIAEGLWLDEIILNCNAPLSTPPTYAFEDGTSMATPQVTGAAALLFSLKPSATVAEVRQALLTTTKATPSLAGKTVTGGRLDVTAAMNALVPPTVTVTEGPSGTTAATGATFKFATDEFAASPVTTECSLDGAAFAPCSSPQTYGSLAAGGHEFRVEAKDGTRGGDASATRTWSVEGPVTPPSEPESPPVVVTPPAVTPPVVKPPETVTGTGETVTKQEDAAGRSNPPATPSPTPSTPSSPTTTPGTTPTGCTVPKLAGKSLGAAKAALGAAGCKLGHVTSPKAKRDTKAPKLVVKASTPAAGGRTSGTVAITLAAKPKPHRH
jgi:subtilisin family serine protease